MSPSIPSPPVVELLGHRQDEGVGQLDLRLGVSGSQRPARRQPGRRTGDRQVAFEGVPDLGAVRHTDLGGVTEGEQGPHIPAQARIAGRQGRGGPGEVEGHIGHPCQPAILDLHALDVDAETDRQLLGGPKRNARIDVVGLDVELQACAPPTQGLWYSVTRPKGAPKPTPA